MCGLRGVSFPFIKVMIFYFGKKMCLKMDVVLDGIVLQMKLVDATFITKSMGILDVEVGMCFILFKWRHYQTTDNNGCK